MTLLRYLLAILDWLVPRFITEDCALSDCGTHWDIECCLDDVEAGEVFDGIASMRSFTWLGIGLFPTQVGEIRPWVNPKGGEPQ